MQNTNIIKKTGATMIFTRIPIAKLTIPASTAVITTVSDSIVFLQQLFYYVRNESSLLKLRFKKLQEAVHPIQPKYTGIRKTSMIGIKTKNIKI